jgi:hypothetical protein
MKLLLVIASQFEKLSGGNALALVDRRCYSVCDYFNSVLVTSRITIVTGYSGLPNMAK